MENICRLHSLISRNILICFLRLHEKICCGYCGVFSIYKPPRCFLPNVKSNSLSIQKKKRKIDFQDGLHGGHLGFPVEILFFPEHRFRHFMQIVSNGDHLHKMSTPISEKKKKKKKKKKCIEITCPLAN